MLVNNCEVDRSRLLDPGYLSHRACRRVKIAADFSAVVRVRVLIRLAETMRFLYRVYALNATRSPSLGRAARRVGANAPPASVRILAHCAPRRGGGQLTLVPGLCFGLTRALNIE